MAITIIGILIKLAFFFPIIIFSDEWIFTSRFISVSYGTVVVKFKEIAVVSNGLKYTEP
jgi:hypothetical protein